MGRARTPPVISTGPRQAHLSDAQSVTSGNQGATIVVEAAHRVPANEAGAVKHLSSQLLASAGEYLHSPLRRRDLTCAACAAPVNARPLCYRCEWVYAPSALAAKQVGFVIYAVKDRQSGYLMRGYKSAPPVREHIRYVGALLWIGLSHRRCAAARLGAAVTHWATVPSLPAKPGRHALNSLVRRNPFLRLPELSITARRSASDYRELRPGNFEVPPIDAGAHVLLIDDTWASGGHAQSAAAALTRAGASLVSILAVARWLEPDDETTAAFLADSVDAREFDPDRCPWTGAGCPPSPNLGLGSVCAQRRHSSTDPSSV